MEGAFAPTLDRNVMLVPRTMGTLAVIRSPQGSDQHSPAIPDFRQSLRALPGKAIPLASTSRLFEEVA